MRLNTSVLKKPAWLCYLFAVSLTVLALLLSMMLWSLMFDGPLVLVIGAVALSVWFGGPGSGLVSTLLSIIWIDFFLLDPLHTPFGQASDSAQLLIFGLVAIIIIVMGGTHRRSNAVLRQTRDELAAILNTVSDGITAENVNGALVYANQAAAQHNGFSSVDAMMSQPVHDLQRRYEFFDVNGERMPFTRLPRFYVFRTGKPGSIIFKQHFIDTGEEKWVQLSSSPIHDDAGNVTLAVNIFKDVTAEIEVQHQRLEQIEKQLFHYMEELHSSNEKLQQFAYIASHDLQEPLRKIKSYLQRIERRYSNLLDDDGKEFIGLAVDGAQRMQQLIHDLLAYSRLQWNLRTFELINLTDTVADVLNTLQLQIEDSQALVSYDNLPCVYADARQMTQLFQNLFSNAIKYHRQDTLPEVHLRVTNCDEGWCFSVSDNGIGIDPEQHDRIFAVFQRLHHRKVYAGTGIGLAICRRVVENHGGRIWVESAPGEGATFHFTLPSTNQIAETRKVSDAASAG